MLQTPPPNSAAVLARARDSLLIGVVSIWGLSAAQGFLVPLALAILAFVLITAVSDYASARLRFPHWLADLSGVIAVLTGFLGMGYIIASQATNFARTVSTYEIELDAAVSRFVGLIGPTATKVLTDMITAIDFQSVALIVADGARSFLTTFLLICLYVFFMMAERRAMSHKIVLAAASEDMAREVNTALTAISISLQRYVSVKTFVSFLTGMVSYLLFRLIGIEFPETWAVITFALNFIPSIGSIIAVIFPAAFALLQFETLGPFLFIVFGCGTIQFLIGNLMDPAMMGRSLNLSTLVVILALTFWSAVWGIIGAFLSVPLTVCLLIIFSQIKSLRPLAILLSKDGNLDDERCE